MFKESRSEGCLGGWREEREERNVIKIQSETKHKIKNIHVIDMLVYNYFPFFQNNRFCTIRKIQYKVSINFVKNILVYYAPQF